MSETESFAPPYPKRSRGYADVKDLQPHPKNEELYDNRDNSDLIERIDENGFLESQRLLVCSDGTILSGHRRWVAAVQLGMDRVPIEARDINPESDQAVLELLTANDYRDKTPAEKIREGEVWEQIESEDAEERMNNPTQNFGEGDTGEAKEKAAEKVGVSDETYRKGKKVKEKAEDGDETAQEEWGKMETGEQSIHGAYSQVKESDKDTDDEAESDISQFTSSKSDEWSSPRELVQPLNDAIGGYDLDPASGAEESPFASNTFTKDDNGLSQDWFGKVWVNPPYSEMAKWTDKVLTEVENEDVKTITYLCKGDSSTEWWQNAVSNATVLTAIDHRLSFGDGDNSAPFASHVIVFGDVTTELVIELQSHGAVLTPGWDNE